MRAFKAGGGPGTCDGKGQKTCFYPKDFECTCQPGRRTQPGLMRRRCRCSRDSPCPPENPLSLWGVLHYCSCDAATFDAAVVAERADKMSEKEKPEPPATKRQKRGDPQVEARAESSESFPDLVHAFAEQWILDSGVYTNLLMCIPTTPHVCIYKSSLCYYWYFEKNGDAHGFGRCRRERRQYRAQGMIRLLSAPGGEHRARFFDVSSLWYG